MNLRHLQAVCCLVRQELRLWDAKKAYAHTAAFGLRVKDSVMKTVTEIKENANDILAEAKEINEKKAAEAQEKAEQSVIKDAAVANA